MASNPELSGGSSPKAGESITESTEEAALKKTRARTKSDSRGSSPPRVSYPIHLSYTPLRLSDGVYEFHKPASGPIELDIVFFHGFQAGTFDDAFIRTWMTFDGSACWLNTWLAGRFPQSRILSVSYDSSARLSASSGGMDMYLIVENLVHLLLELENVGEHVPVVLVGHCVGGLVIKEICLTANRLATFQDGPGSRHRQFLKNLRGMFFYDTAFLGSHVSTGDEANSGGPLLQYLRLLSEKSARINDEFSKLRRSAVYCWKTYGVIAANKTRTSMLPFADHVLESRSMDLLLFLLTNLQGFISLEDSLVVEEGSGRIDVDDFATVSGVDHLTICQPKDQHSNSFLLLVHFLEEILKEEEERNIELKLRLQLPLRLIQSDKQLKTLIQMLKLDSPELIRLSLVGMDGIGKSTLAKQLLIRLQHRFHLVSFLEFERMSKEHQGENLKKLVAENLFRGSGKQVVLEGGASWSMLRRKRVLIIADEVELEEQIRPFLASDWCADGSRLIITTGSRGLLANYDVIEYSVPPLSPWQSMELFKAHIGSSLQQEIPEKLISEIVEECGGLPLALELLATYLSRKKKKMVRFCSDALVRLRTDSALDGMGENRAWRAPKMILDDLDPLEKKIFLDLTTFDFYGADNKQYSLDTLTTAWDTRGESGYRVPSRLAVENLEDKCFLRIVPGSQPETGTGAENEMVRIHKVLRNMGRWISRPLTEKFDRRPDLCRGLWELEDGKRALNEVEIGENEVLQTLSLTSDARVHGECSTSGEVLKWGSLGRFLALRLLRMSNLNMAKGSDELIFPRSLSMLHMIDCSGPKQPVFRWQWWKAEYWPIREENVECLRQLSVLLLHNCGPVRLPPNFHRLKSLRILQIHDKGVNSAMELPQMFGHLPALQVFDLSTPVKELPESLLALSTLRTLKLKGCSLLKAWPVGRGPNAPFPLASLTKLELINLPDLSQLPNSFGDMRSLETLVFNTCSALEELPDGFGGLQQLKILQIQRCEKLKRLCDSFHNLRRLEDLQLFRLPTLLMLPSKFGLLQSVENLYIEYCNSLQELPQSLTDIRSLSFLSITDCNDLLSFRHDPWYSGDRSQQQRRLESFAVNNCPNLQNLPEFLDHSEELKRIEITRCKKLPNLPNSMMQLRSLTTLQISKCEDLEHLPDFTSQLASLTSLCISDVPNLVDLPESMGELKCLQKLSVVRCQSLCYLPKSLGLVTSLREFTLEGCGHLIEVPDSLGDLRNLTVLNIADCGYLVALPETICLLRSLRFLKLNSCEHLRSLPQSFGQLPSLANLRLQQCPRLQALPESFDQLPSLEFLYLRDCDALQTLPPFLGRVISLEMLYIRKCESLTTLPESIPQLPRLSSLTVRECGHITQLPTGIAKLEELWKLLVKDCGAFEVFPSPSEQKTSLRKLALPSFKDPESLLHVLQRFNPKVFWKLRLDLSGCTVDKSILTYIQKLTEMETFGICHCASLEGVFEALQHCISLHTLKILHCEEMKEIPEGLGNILRLRRISIKDCSLIERLPFSLGQVAGLERLEIVDCESLKIIPDSIGQLKSLKSLTIRNCGNIKGLPESLGQLTDLTLLSIWNCRGLMELPESLGQLLAHSRLELTACENIKTLPESVGDLLLLESLIIRDCNSFEQLPKSVDVDDPSIKILNCKNFNR